MRPRSIRISLGSIGYHPDGSTGIPGVFGINPWTWTANTFDPATDRIGSYLICECVAGCHSGDCLGYGGFGMWKKDQSDEGGFSYRKRYFIGFVIIFNFWMRNKWKVAAAREARSTKCTGKKRFYLDLFRPYWLFSIPSPLTGAWHDSNLIYILNYKRLHRKLANSLSKFLQLH